MDWRVLTLSEQAPGLGFLAFKIQRFSDLQSRGPMRERFGGGAGCDRSEGWGDLGEVLGGGLQEGWGRGRGARGRAHRRGHALPAAATRSQFPPSLPGAGSQSPPTRLRPSRRGRRQLGPRCLAPRTPPGLPSPSLYPPVAPAAQPSSLAGLDNFACRPRSPVPGSNCTEERGRGKAGPGAELRAAPR